MERGTNWSITINNPTKEDDAVIAKLKSAPWFVSFDSQLEKGKEGTPHIQGHLRTRQVRFSAIKKALPRAHIELARNAQALAKYVAKEDTREASRPQLTGDIPTLWDYTQEVASEITEDAVFKFMLMMDKECNEIVSPGDAALWVADRIVGRHIREGRRGVEFISMNPLFRATLKTHWRNILIRENAASCSPCEEELS